MEEPADIENLLNQMMKTQIKDKSTEPEDLETGGPTMEQNVLNNAGEGTTVAGISSYTMEISRLISFVMFGEEK